MTAKIDLDWVDLRGYYDYLEVALRIPQKSLISPALKGIRRLKGCYSYNNPKNPQNPNNQGWPRSSMDRIEVS
jgi:hypothetical protein